MAFYRFYYEIYITDVLMTQIKAIYLPQFKTLVLQVGHLMKVNHNNYE
jgi:hypothetical protein